MQKMRNGNMVIKSIIGAICTGLSVVSFSANAATVTQGNLTSDNATNIITGGS